jgi:hypothetical protein
MNQPIFKNFKEKKEISNEAVAELWVRLLFAHIEAGKQQKQKSTEGGGKT